MFLRCSPPSLNPPLPGRAIKHVKESIFTPDGGARRGVPKVLVVLTDGRSQDDVNTVSKEMQVEGGWVGGGAAAAQEVERVDWRVSIPGCE